MVWISRAVGGAHASHHLRSCERGSGAHSREPRVAWRAGGGGGGGGGRGGGGACVASMAAGVERRCIVCRRKFRIRLSKPKHCSSQQKFACKIQNKMHTRNSAGGTSAVRLAPPWPSVIRLLSLPPQCALLARSAASRLKAICCERLLRVYKRPLSPLLFQPPKTNNVFLLHAYK